LLPLLFLVDIYNTSPGYISGGVSGLVDLVENNSMPMKKFLKFAGTYRGVYPPFFSNS
jgi:hypothetical protein